jgi:hypothetical protein
MVGFAVVVPLGLVVEKQENQKGQTSIHSCHSVYTLGTLVVARGTSPPFCFCSSTGAFSMLPLLKYAYHLFQQFFCFCNVFCCHCLNLHVSHPAKKPGAHVHLAAVLHESVELFFQYSSKMKIMQKNHN